MSGLDDSDDPQARPRGADPRPLDQVLAAAVGRRGWDARLRGARVHALWPTIAGPELARYVAPVRLAGGVLVVRVGSAVWATQVRYLAADLVARANAVLGEGEVTTLTVTTGADPPERRARR